MPTLALPSSEPELTEAEKEALRRLTRILEPIAPINSRFRLSGVAALLAIAEADGKLNVSELGEELNIAQGQATRLSDSLRRKRLIVKARAGVRGKLLFLTDKAKAILRTV